MASTWSILAPVDLSLGTDAPVQHAIETAGALSAELVLLNVIETRRVAWPSSAFGRERPDVDIHRVLLPGEAPAAIARYADFVAPSLLLMPSRRYGRWSGFWQKSVTAELMKLTSRPICVSRCLDEETPFRMRRILCVVGLEGRDEPVIRFAEEIAERTYAELILLHVVPEISEGLLAYAIDGLQARPLSVDLAREKIRDLAAGLSVPVTTSVIVGRPGKCIALAAKEHEADVVAGARTSPEGRSAYMVEVEAALSRLHCPVITMPARTEAARWRKPDTYVSDMVAKVGVEPTR